MAGNQATEQPQETFKQQLDRVAEERRTGADSRQRNPIVEKGKHSFRHPQVQRLTRHPGSSHGIRPRCLQGLRQLKGIRGGHEQV